MARAEKSGYGMKPSERRIAQAALEHDLNAGEAAKALDVPYSRVLSVLKKQGVRDYIIALMEEDGLDFRTPMRALFAALEAEKVEANFNGGEHFNLGPDHGIRIKAAETIYKVTGAIGAQAKDKDTDKKVVVIFQSTPIDDPNSEDGVIDVTPA